MQRDWFRFDRRTGTGWVVWTRLGSRTLYRLHTSEKAALMHLNFLHYIVNYTIARTMYQFVYGAGPIAWALAAVAIFMVILYLRGRRRASRS